MLHLYECKARCDRWVAEIRWLYEDWAKMNLVRYPTLFPREVEADFSVLGASQKSESQRLQHMAFEVISRYECSTMRTRFSLKSRNFGVTFEEIIGYVACDSMLNDSVVHFACQAICDWTEDCVFANSLVFSVNSEPRLPTRKILTTEYVVLPVHLSDIHWGVLVVNLVYPARITMHYYELLCRASYRPVMQDRWYQQLKPFLEKWHGASGEKTAFPDVTEEWLLQPKQQDGSSCGIMVIGQVYSLLRDEYTFHRNVPTIEYVQIMRLRILWVMFCKTIMENSVEVNVEETNLELVKYFEKGNLKVTKAFV